MLSLVRERYEVLEVKGQGGQGAVMRARDIVHERQVALKVRALRGGEDQATLLQEARVLLGVRPHPNLPVLREDFVMGDCYHLVMDWIEGRDLRQVLQEDGSPGLPPEQVLGYLAEVAGALDHLHAHEPPVVHQDVKPANLLLTADGRVVLVDFGISWHRKLPGAGARGTRDYAAPEVVCEGPSPASDIFSLAVTAYTLLTGAPPRPGVQPELPGPHGDAMMSVLRRGLAIDPRRRPHSASDLVAGLRAAAGLAPPAPAPTSTGGERRRSWSGTRPGRGRHVAAAASAFAVVALVAAWLTLGPPARHGPGPASRGGAATSSGAAPFQLIGEGRSSCPRGYLCVWEAGGFRGRGLAIFGTERHWDALPAPFRFVTAGIGSAFDNGYPETLPNVALYPGDSFSGMPLVVMNGTAIGSIGPAATHIASDRWF